ncbi:Hypothetical predicted protein [Olea europaea subsp. europaea]|uniref:Uncharacterized protein n=1 Tax=Olea europaea subsp. europaea TaxID=158383 RepID=A0A8S0PLB3_OLEEU|nr:Hypothetical predicted protein [Olea europaea subsp. europaea]
MGALCSKAPTTPNPYAQRGRAPEKQYYQRQQAQVDDSKIVMSPPTGKETLENQVVKESPRLSSRYSSISDDEFYDGIPRYQRSPSRRSRSTRVTKVSEVGSLLGKAGSAGLERAAGVLNTAFASGAANKNSELSILAFEIANTIVKGSSLMQSLSRRSIRQLKEVVLPAEAVRQLISEDMDELLRIVAADKREELKVFLGEVVRFGNRCKDPQWHDLDRFFEKRSRDRTPQNQLRETAESVMEQLMILVQLTAELYQELHALDTFEQDYRLKRIEEIRLSVIQRGDKDGLAVLAAELKSQKKLVKNLKKKSLWSRSLDEVMEKLVDIVLFLNQEINNIFGSPVGETVEKGSANNKQRLGPAGLALHYANIILLIDSIVVRPSSMPPNARDTLYQSLPPSLKSPLKSKLQSFHVQKELTVTEIQEEMEKTLQWLVPVATSTAKAHHGFGWVGEWGNTGSDLNRKSVGPIDIMQIETLHHADRQKTEAYILELLLWLNYLVTQSKARVNSSEVVTRVVRSPASSPPRGTDLPSDSKAASSSTSASTTEENDKNSLVINSTVDYVLGEEKAFDVDA